MSSLLLRVALFCLQGGRSGLISLSVLSGSPLEGSGNQLFSLA